MSWLDQALGLTADTLTWWQTGLRAVLSIIVLVAIVRFGNKRLFAKGSALDLVVSIMVGSVMANSIHSPGSLIPVYVAVFVLVGTHALLTALAARFDFLGPLIKGNRVRLARDGELIADNMRSSAITERELLSALRSNGDQADMDALKDAWLERDGSITVSTVDPEPRVIAIDVRDGVQTVRVQLG